MKATQETNINSISIILRRPPYGSVDASEAIRHALGGAIEDISVKLILVDGGVTNAMKRQDISNTEYLSIESGVRDCIDMGVEVYAEGSSVEKFALNPDNIIDGVIILDSNKIARLIKDSDTTMIF